MWRRNARWEPLVEGEIFTGRDGQRGGDGGGGELGGMETKGTSAAQRTFSEDGNVIHAVSEAATSHMWLSST